MGYWAMFATAGPVTWEAPGSNLGGDVNKFDIYDTAEDPNTQPMKFRKYGESNWQTYQPGQNGAPVNSPDGLRNSLYAACIDAMASGMESVWEEWNRIQSLKYVPYQSNCGGFNPQAVQAGYHVNGFGPLNRGQFNHIRARDQKRAICLESSGIDGRMLSYYNGFLCPHEYEDVTCQGVSFRAYGRQTYQIVL